MNQNEVQLEECVALLERGELTEEQLRALVQGTHCVQPIQSLMYAGAVDNSLFSGLAALSIIEAGQRVEISADRAKWPYHSIVDAMRAGWRVIKFPDFVPDESRNYGLGCEFILER